ncbi:MAG: tetratricopeptide repeat protein [Planctomycetaceae bacterium]
MRFSSTWSVPALAALAMLSIGCQSTKGTSWAGRLTPDFLKKDTEPEVELEHPARLHVAYALWQEQIGNFVEARKSYERALQEQEHNVDATLGLARIDHLAGRTADAERRFQEAIRLKPDDPQVLDSIGQFYVSQQRYPEAIDLLRRAAATAPNDATYRFHLAIALAKSGDLRGAMPHFVQSVGEAQANYNLGVIAFEQGHAAASEPYFRQALLLKPNLAQAQQYLEEIERARAEQFAQAPSPNPPVRQQHAARPHAGTFAPVHHTAAPNAKPRVQILTVETVRQPPPPWPNSDGRAAHSGQPPIESWNPSGSRRPSGY